MATAADVGHALPHVAGRAGCAGRARRAASRRRGEDSDRSPSGHQPLDDLVDVQLGPATLGVPRVAPVEHHDVPPPGPCPALTSAHPLPFTVPPPRGHNRVRLASSACRPGIHARSATTYDRSVRLFRSFLTEQSDPDGFYTLIADDAVRLMRPHLDFEGSLVADFGGGPGFYSAAFRAAGARTVLIDASLDEILLHGRRPPTAVVGRAEQSPLADGTVDVAFSSNLLEHVPDLARTADEIVRVVRPGGHVVLSYTVWLGPGAATRPRRGTTSAGRARPGGTSAGPAGCPRTSTAPACTPPPAGRAWPGCAAAPTSRCSTSGRGTCRRSVASPAGPRAARDRHLEPLDGAPQAPVRPAEGRRGAVTRRLTGW